MKTSIVSAAFLLLGAGAATVGAAAGDNIALTGSDTLFKVTQDILMACNGAGVVGNVTNHGLSYVRGGSGAGAGAMDAGSQHLAPMTRALKSVEYCNGSGITTQSSTDAILIGADGVSVLANAGQSCSPDLAQAKKTVSCQACSAANRAYALGSSLDVLRLIYAGTDSAGLYSGDFGCNGPLRRALVANWSSLFNASCAAGKCDGSISSLGVTQPLGLSHAWRRSDLSDTTDAFVTLVNMGSRTVGKSPLFQPTSTSFTVNPFCNSVDANAAATTTPCTQNSDCQAVGDAFTNAYDGVCEAGFCRPGSLGSYADYADHDPIRVLCDSDSQDNDTENVCESDGTLGLVLPIAVPNVSSVTTTDNYPMGYCDPSNTCALSATGDPTLPCPRGGPKKLGRCYQPSVRNTDGTLSFNCIARSFNKCFADRGVDGRAYNLPLKKSQGSAGAAYVADAYDNLITGSFFRIHMNAPSSYAPAGALTCQQADDTNQIGCLVASDPCSIGYAGRKGDLLTTQTQALSIDGILPRPDQNISNLFASGQACSASNRTCPTGYTCNTQFNACYPTGQVVYPLAQRLSLASVPGFGSLQGGELELAYCFADNSLVTTAIQNSSAVTVPSGVQCEDYPELDASAANAAFLPTCPGATSGGANVNACLVPLARSCAPGGAGMTNCGGGSESCCTSLPVTGGSFNRAQPSAPATVSSFRLDKYDVTVGRFRQFVAAWNNGTGFLPSAGSGKHTYLNGGLGLADSSTAGTYEAGWLMAYNTYVAPTNANLACTTSPNYNTWTNAAGSQELLPINCVTWEEAYAFCIWDGGFLPSDAELEYADAGGSQQRPYPWGSIAPGASNQFAIYADSGGNCLYPSGAPCSGFMNIAPVGTASMGAGRYGQLDLAGEIWQWTLDWYNGHTYANQCTDCEYGKSDGLGRVPRGGCFLNSQTYFPPFRGNNDPTSRNGGIIGFRCARPPW
jgi:formylglycine-generating enzyme required for sulfatase activity/ABC-type phosphate transport system substrate-binding protein